MNVSWGVKGAVVEVVELLPRLLACHVPMCSPSRCQAWTYHILGHLQP
jgi:hypothetical protein